MHSIPLVLVAACYLAALSRRYRIDRAATASERRAWNQRQESRYAAATAEIEADARHAKAMQEARERWEEEAYQREVEDPFAAHVMAA